MVKTNIKLYLTIAVFIFIGISTISAIPLFAQETKQDLQVVILQLQEQIKTLQVQIDQLKSELTATKSELAEVITELKFTQNLYRGTAGEEVKNLQEFLKRFPDIYPQGLVTGYFGPLTEAAVKRLQEKNNIETVGVVGPKTRARLNELITSGAGLSGVVSPGLTTAPGVQDKVVDTKETTTASQIVPSTANPSGTIPASPATPAEPATPSSGGRSGDAAPARPATPATPAEPTTPQDTTPPVISNIQTTNITETSATITWTTDESASGEVYYASSSPIFGTSTLSKVTGSNNVTSHSINLSNLTHSHIYYYIAVSKDASGNTATSSEQSFTTLTPPPPSPPVSNWSNVQFTNFSGNGNIYYGEYPALVWNGNGYGVVWSGSDGTPVEQTNVENIFFKKLDANGNPLGSHMRVTDHGYCGCLTTAVPNIVWNGSKYGVAWTDNQGNGDGQNMRFVTLDSNGNKLTDIILSVPNDNTNTNRPGLKWTGLGFAVAWQGTNKFYTEIGNDGQTIVVGKKIATDSEWNFVHTSDFNGTVISNNGKIYFSNTNMNQELVSTIAGSNTWPFITWNEINYAIVWMNVQNNQLQLYFGTKQ